MQKYDNNRKSVSWVAGAITVAAFTILLFFVLFQFGSLRDTFNLVLRSIQSVIIGLIVAYLINPVMVFLEKRLLRLFSGKEEPSARMKRLVRGISVAISLILLLAVIIVLIFMLVPQLIESITSLVNQVPGQTQRVIEWMNALLSEHSDWANENQELSDMINSYLTSISDYAVTWLRDNLLGSVNQLVTILTGGVITVVKFLFNFIIGLVVSIYVLSSKERLLGTFKKIIYALRKQETGDEIIATLQHINEIFTGFISGKITDSLIIGVLCFIGVTLLNMPYPLLISVIIGVTNIIPFFGPYIGAVPTALIVLIYNPLQGLIYIVFILVLQQFDGNILGPKILGDSTGLSSFWVIFAILLGGGVFGVPGMILGVPTFASVYYLVKKYMERRLKRKDLPTDTGWYAVPGELRTEGIEEEIAREAAVEAAEACGMKEKDAGKSAKKREERRMRETVAEMEGEESSHKKAAGDEAGAAASWAEKMLRKVSGGLKESEEADGKNEGDSADPGADDQ